MALVPRHPRLQAIGEVVISIAAGAALYFPATWVGVDHAVALVFAGFTAGRVNAKLEYDR